MKFPPGGKGHFAEKFQSECLVEEIQFECIGGWLTIHGNLSVEIKSYEGILNHPSSPNNPYNRALFSWGFAFGMVPLRNSPWHHSCHGIFPTAPYHSFNDITGQNSARRITWIDHSLRGLCKKLHVCPWKMLVGRLLFLWHFAYFQGLC